MTQVVNAKDAKDVVGAVIGGATTVVMDGAAGLVTGEAGLKNIVKSQADIKSSSSKELAQVRTASRIGNRVVKVGTQASATQQNTPDSSKKSNNSGQSQQNSGKTRGNTGPVGNENQT